MHTADAEAPRLIHASAGRVRIHLARWSGQGQEHLRLWLCDLPGVYHAQATQITRNILVHFDAATTSGEILLATVAAVDLDQLVMADGVGITVAAQPSQSEQSPQQPARQRPSSHRKRRTVRARIAVPGMDRSPRLAGHVANHLARNHPAVRARISVITGRVLVEFDEHKENLGDLVSEITGIELPDVPEGDEPADPLDPAPLVQSATRTAGALVGLTLVSLRRLFGFSRLVDAAVAAQATAVVAVLTGFPVVRAGVRRLLGRNLGDITLSLPIIVGLLLMDSPLGLLLSAAEGLRLLTEVIARRRAWRSFERSLGETPTPVPGTFVRLGVDMRVPLSGMVIEGTGTATGQNGLPIPIAPGAILPAGARLCGGGCVLELQAHADVAPESRPAPVRPSTYDHYIQFMTPASLAYAALSGVLARSFSSILEGLLLVSPRTAVVGLETAELGVSARALRAGVTVVSAHGATSIRLPHVMLLDGPRVLTDGLELASVLPIDGRWNDASLMHYVAAIVAAAGSPWGRVFAVSGEGGATASDGTFDGMTAIATIHGVRYSLGPVPDESTLPAPMRGHAVGNHMLQLLGEYDRTPLGYLALRPRLARGAAELIQCCRRHGVAIDLLAADDTGAAQALAHRVRIPLVTVPDAASAVRARQAEGLYVAFVSDHARAMHAFDASDLGIGIVDPGTHLPARADIIAPDLTGVAAIVESAARGEVGVRGSIALSLAANVAGAVLGLWGDIGIEAASDIMYLTALGAIAWDWLALRGSDRPHPIDTISGASHSSPQR